MQDYRLSMDETKTINQAMEVKMQEVDQDDLPGRKVDVQMTDPSRLRRRGKKLAADRQAL